MRTIDEVCDVINGGTPKTGVRGYWDGGHQWVTPAEMGKCKSPFIAETARTLTDTGIANSSARPLPPLSVILSSRAPIGHLAINTVPMSFNQGCKGLIPNPNLHYKYLYYFLHANVELLNSLGTGATFKELSGGKLKSVQIPVPPLEEQKQIVALLDEAFEGIAKATANAELNLANVRELLDVQLESVFEGTSDWIEATLKEVCSVITDGTHQTPTYFESGYLFLSSRNVTSRSIDWEKVKYIDEAQHIAMQKRVSPKIDDILLAKNGTTGVAAIVDREVDFDIYVSLALLRPLEKISPNFLLHFVNSPIAKRQFNSRLKGTGVPNLHLKEIREVKIRFPASAAEQASIIDKVDEIYGATSALLDHYRRRVSDLDSLKQSILYKAFSGELTFASERRANDNAVAATTSPQYTADVLAFAYAKHRAAQRDRTFGRVKGQKVLHLVEAVAGVDLGRDPIKDAAGPNDSAHMRCAEDWALQQGYFAFEARETGGYDFRPGRSFENTLASTYARLSPHKDAIANVIDLLVPMDSQEAEVLATVHAAWNNLIIDGVEPTRDAIVTEARENWTASKLEIQIAKFDNAIRFIRQNNIIPDGSAKAVRKRQESLF